MEWKCEKHCDPYDKLTIMGGYCDNSEACCRPMRQCEVENIYASCTYAHCPSHRRFYNKGCAEYGVCCDRARGEQYTEADYDYYDGKG
jgi:hypothetical protein